MKSLVVQILMLMTFHDVFAQTAGNDFSIDGIPKKLSWVNAPLHWTYQQKILKIQAGAKTDLFLDPRHEYSFTNSPKAIFTPSDYFQLSARATVEFKTDFDAGVLVLYSGKTSWAKLCFEFSPDKKPFIVSVVNNGISDDCNHVPVDGNKVYLRVSGLGNHVYVFHYSLDGKFWQFVRYFSMATKENIRVGFSSQSPTGESCETNFSEISYQEKKLKDVRNGE